jgi:hypothetical protein
MVEVDEVGGVTPRSACMQIMSQVVRLRCRQRPWGAVEGMAGVRQSP